MEKPSLGVQAAQIVHECNRYFTVIACCHDLEPLWFEPPSNTCMLTMVNIGG